MSAGSLQTINTSASFCICRGKSRIILQRCRGIWVPLGARCAMLQIMSYLHERKGVAPTWVTSAQPNEADGT